MLLELVDPALDAPAAQQSRADQQPLEAGGDQQGIMGTLLILDLNDIVGQGDQADGINEIANNVIAITLGNWSNSKRSVAELAYAAAVSARVWLR